MPFWSLNATGACSANDSVRTTSLASSRARSCCNHRPKPTTVSKHCSFDFPGFMEGAAQEGTRAGEEMLTAIGVTAAA